MKTNRIQSEGDKPEATIFEEYIPINYKVVGRREWLEGVIKLGALAPDKRVEIHTSGDLQPIKDWFDAQKTQGLDTETGGKDEGDGLDPISGNSKILLAQYGTKDMVYLFEPNLIPEFKAQLQSPDRVLIGQNLKHDFEFILTKYGFPLVNMYDTMLAEQLLTAGLQATDVGLKDLSRKYPPNYITSKSIRDQFTNFREGDKFTADMLYYGARDVFELFPVYEGQKLELKRLGLESVAQDEFNCIPVTSEMELTGITLDEQTLLLTESFFQKRKEEINRRVTEVYNSELREKGLREQLTVMPAEDVEDHFDLDSSQQKLITLRALGYDAENVQRETLENLGTDLTKLLAEYSLCLKMISTYGQGLLAKRSPWTGKFHPEFHQMGKGYGRGEGEGKTTTTATGRYTSNAQNMPRPEKRYALAKDPKDLARVRTEFAKQLKQGFRRGCTVIGEPLFLGVIGGKEYYLFPADNKQSKPYVQWRVPNIREAFRARPGYKMLTADYSQIEVRIMAELSGDPWLTAAINSGKDIHCYMASDVYHIPYDEFYAAYKNDKHPKHDDYANLRSNIKGTTFGVPYGAGAQCVANNTGLSLDQASDLITRFFAKAGVLKLWLDKQRALGLTLGYTKSLRGRMRFYERYDQQRKDFYSGDNDLRKETIEAEEELDAQIKRWAGNHPIQASCVDLLKPALVKIYLALRGGSWTGDLLYNAHIKLTVHDEIVMEAREDEAEAVAKIMADCMLGAYYDIIKSVVHGPVDVTIADFWKK